jgi:hypothetical protein
VTDAEPAVAAGVALACARNHAAERQVVWRHRDTVSAGVSSCHRHVPLNRFGTTIDQYGERMITSQAVAATRRAALGFKVHIGWAAVVAVGGPVDAPEVLAKTRIDLATSFDEGAVFHVGQALPTEEARALVRDAEVRFAGRARAELASFTRRLDKQVVAAGMVAAPAKSLPPLETILRSHALVHAAEGELYRRVFTEAGVAIGAKPKRVPGDILGKNAAAALGVTQARLAARLAAMGKASGKPWAADQKQATLVAWLLLATAGKLSFPEAESR